ncbi:hypothetical protein B0H14DRAFT_2570687 [Mycena olivaceomarginata]|nr:hypothetical protein B0H14DRAFT_2570687 [Mycena olivaceomarginata]
MLAAGHCWASTFLHFSEIAAGRGPAPIDPSTISSGEVYEARTECYGMLLAQKMEGGARRDGGRKKELNESRESTRKSVGYIRDHGGSANNDYIKQSAKGNRG